MVSLFAEPKPLIIHVKPINVKRWTKMAIKWIKISQNETLQKIEQLKREALTVPIKRFTVRIPYSALKELRH